MAVYSMTGYANASATLAKSESAALHDRGANDRQHAADRPSISVELRSVNGRFLDVALRLPDDFRHLEPELRGLVAARVKRGKVELRIALGSGTSSRTALPSVDELDRLAALQALVRGRLPEARPLSVHEALQSCREAGAEPIGDEVVLDAAVRAVAGLCESREREGARLAGVLGERTAQLRRLAAAAAPLVPVAIRKHQERFLERWKEALDAAGAGATVRKEAAEDRALGEAAAFAVRIDIAEELARLGSHLDEIDRLLGNGGEIGKRLEFLIQELLREANTLGSKSASLETTQIAVDMKVAIEQLREQVQNVE